ncbi:MAG: C10 family peptidase, partial [Alloprevotella sp.]|nr:C10 family peptidase [Alloprevotella sp.]
MNRYRLIFLLLALSVAALAFAGVRPKAQMKRIARQTLEQKLRRFAASEPLELRGTDNYSVYGHVGGGYVVVASSELLPEVLGYADTPFAAASNPNFTWWLSQIDSVAAEANRTGMPFRRASRPDAARYPTSVPAMVTTRWGQEEPYWNLCPRDPAYGYCYTGCVATAMAQILNYHKFPPHCIGERTITYPLKGDDIKATVTADFGGTEYDWTAMRDSYSGTYTDHEAEAVATLMMHCGVASRMNYSTSGSGAYTGDAAYGLREYFGIKAARACRRSDYVDSDWMDMVYTELSEHRPILYGGVDMSGFGGGHAFILDGYNSDGLMHVNWGWDGDADGYYDIDVLNPRTYRFADDQDMIIGIYGKPMDLHEGAIDVPEAGRLAAMLSDDDAVQYTSLTVTGAINGADLSRLRFMAGRDAAGRTTTSNLRELDLSGARFVESADVFLSDGAQQYTTADDVLPAMAFSGCQGLERLTLPAGLKRWGRGALSMCVKLEQVEVPAPSADAEFEIDGSVVYNAGRSQVLAVLPSAQGRLQLPVGVEALDDYALSGCRNLTSLHLPSSVTRLGAKALYYCTGLTELRSYALVPPAVGADAFGAIDAAKCRLAVRRDMRQPYVQADGWRMFAQNVREFFTIIRPRNSSREYGDENPLFGYVLEGDDVEGEPLLLSEAVPTSPVGRYAITASAGTITDEAVEYGEAVLVVRRAPLTVCPEDCTI